LELKMRKELKMSGCEKLTAAFAEAEAKVAELKETYENTVNYAKYHSVLASAVTGGLVDRSAARYREAVLELDRVRAEWLGAT
jgi:hypothetical protein